jgi:PAS domain S-box-containing protein
MDIDQSTEILRLRATVRDLLALSIIPEAWVAREPPAIAADLADLLIGSLKLDFAFVRLCDPTGCQAVEVTRGDCWKGFPEWLHQRFVRLGQDSRTEIVTNVGGVEKSYCGVVIPIGVNSERGLIAAASNRSNFPDQIDQQLLSVAANNAATAFQNARDINELRTAQKALRDQEQELRKAHDGLEIKVAERTSELRTDVEHRIIRPSGELRTVHSQGDLKKDASGRPCQMFGTVQDITDRKRTQDKIREQEAELQQIVDLAPQLVTVFGPHRERLYANRILLDYLGISLDEWRQRPDSIEFLHPDDRERVHAHSYRALSSGAPYELEFRVRKSSGDYRWFLTRFSPVRDDKGQIMRWYVAATDIEDRKRAEEALQQSQFYLAEGQRLAHIGSWAFDATGFSYWSSELFRIYGLDPVGKPPTVDEYLALVHPEDRAFMKQGIAKMLDDHLAFDFTKRIVRPDGEIRHVRCVGVPVTQEGIFQGFLGTGMDVTEHELLTQELRRREAYLEKAQRLSQTGSFGWRPDSGEIVWSDETYRIFEYDHVVKPTIDLAVQRVHPEDRPDFLKVIDSASAGATQFEHTYRVLLPDGSVKHVHVLAHALQDSSGNREFVGAVTDVTSIKRAEEELRTSEAYLAEAQRLSQTGSWAWSPDRDIRYWSEECYRVLSFDPQDGFPRPEDFFQRLHPDDRLGFRELIQTAIREKAEWETDYRIVHPDGPVRDIHVVGHPVLSTSGHLVEFVGTVIDVTERKRAEQERARLHQLEADLAHTNRVSTLGEMAASLAHEIKQPITAAITSANSCIEWLAHEPPNLDRARAAAARIDKYGNRAAEIIDRIRSFYKKSPPQRELVDVNGIIHEMLALLEGEAFRLSVAMRTDLSTELPKIMVDRVQLQQVFMNLMLNAIEAMKDSGGELTVKSKLQDGQLQFSVSDTGVGLPTDKMDQIFSAFFTTKPQGSGMGLAISRSIVESHGGQLWASANSGRGATFHFTLPTEVP